MFRRGLLAGLCVLAILALSGREAIPGSEAPTPAVLQLPTPSTRGEVSVEEALAARRSIRSFTNQKLTAEEIGQLLWSAQGVTEKRRGFRTAPSAGALYPLEIYAVTAEGVFKYDPAAHSMASVMKGDRRKVLSRAALGQLFVGSAPCSIVITAVYSRTAKKYGARAERYVHIEVGCAAENVMLQAVAMNLGSVAVGAFRDAQVASAIGCSSDEKPLLIIPVGRTGAAQRAPAPEE
jgi:SagB-type dehydrogenase family enzyme